MSQQDVPDLPPERPSRSADAARAAELMRIKAMTGLERMALALELGRRCRLVAGLAGRRPAGAP